MEKKSLQASLPQGIEIPKSYHRYLTCTVTSQKDNQLVVQTTRGTQVMFAIEGKVLRKLKNIGADKEEGAETPGATIGQLDIAPMPELALAPVVPVTTMQPPQATEEELGGRQLPKTMLMSQMGRPSATDQVADLTKPAPDVASQVSEFAGQVPDVISQSPATISPNPKSEAASPAAEAAQLPTGDVRPAEILAQLSNLEHKLGCLEKAMDLWQNWANQLTLLQEKTAGWETAADQITSLAQRVAAVEAKPAAAPLTIETLEQRLATCEAQSAEVATTLHHNTEELGKLATISQKFQELDGQIGKIHKVLEGHHAKIQNSLEAQISQLQHHWNGQMTKLQATCEAQIAKLQTTIQVHGSQLQASEKQLAAHTSQISKMERDGSVEIQALKTTTRTLAMQQSELAAQTTVLTPYVRDAVAGCKTLGSWLWTLLKLVVPWLYRKATAASIVTRIVFYLLFFMVCLGVMLVYWPRPENHTISDNGTLTNATAKNLPHKAVANHTAEVQSEPGVYPKKQSRPMESRPYRASGKTDNKTDLRGNNKWDSPEEYELFVEQNNQMAQLFQEAQTSQDLEKKRNAVQSLKEMIKEVSKEGQRKSLTSHFIKLLHDNDDFVCITCVRGLGELAATEAVPDLLDLMRDQRREKGIREMAIHTLIEIMGATTDARVTEALLLIFKDKNTHMDLRTEAAGTLGKIGDTLVCPELMAGLNDPEPEIQATCARALGNFSYPNAVVPLLQLLASTHADVRSAAVEALGNMELKAGEAAQGLLGLYGDTAISSSLRQTVRDALQKLLPKLHGEIKHAVETALK